MDALEKVRDEVKRIHKESKEEYIRTWFYENHVAVVEKYASEIAEKEGADKEISVLSSLLHDIARAWGVEKEPELMSESLKKAEELMKANGYSEEEVFKVKEAVEAHSCRYSKPETKEGKVLATADALAHLMPDFYYDLKPFSFHNKSDKEYNEWVLKKIERDFYKKIFYAKYRQLAKKRYEKIKKDFSSG